MACNYSALLPYQNRANIGCLPSCITIETLQIDDTSLVCHHSPDSIKNRNSCLILQTKDIPMWHGALFSTPPTFLHMDMTRLNGHLYTSCVHTSEKPSPSVDKQPCMWCWTFHPISCTHKNPLSDENSLGTYSHNLSQNGEYSVPSLEERISWAVSPVTRTTQTWVASMMESIHFATQRDPRAGESKEPVWNVSSFLPFLPWHSTSKDLLHAPFHQYHHLTAGSYKRAPPPNPSLVPLCNACPMHRTGTTVNCPNSGVTYISHQQHATSFTN